MVINFRKRISLMPGVKLNVSKNGLSTTVGTKGGSVNVGKMVYMQTQVFQDRAYMLVRKYHLLPITRKNHKK